MSLQRADTDYSETTVDSFDTFLPGTGRLLYRGFTVLGRKIDRTFERQTPGASTSQEPCPNLPALNLGLEDFDDFSAINEQSSNPILNPDEGNLPDSLSRNASGLLPSISWEDAGGAPVRGLRGPVENIGRIHEARRMNDIDRLDSRKCYQLSDALPVSHLANNCRPLRSGIPFQPASLQLPGDGHPHTPRQHRRQKLRLPTSQTKGKQVQVGLDDFSFLALLSKSSCVKVMLAEEKKTKTLYAIKALKKTELIVDLAPLTPGVESARSDEQVLRAVAQDHHPFVDVYSSFETDKRIYFVMILPRLSQRLFRMILLV